MQNKCKSLCIEMDRYISLTSGLRYFWTYSNRLGLFWILVVALLRQHKGNWVKNVKKECDVKAEIIHLTMIIKAKLLNASLAFSRLFEGVKKTC